MLISSLTEPLLKADWQAIYKQINPILDNMAQTAKLLMVVAVAAFVVIAWVVTRVIKIVNDKKNAIRHAEVWLAVYTLIGCAMLVVLVWAYLYNVGAPSPDNVRIAIGGVSDSRFAQQGTPIEPNNEGMYNLLINIQQTGKLSPYGIVDIDTKQTTSEIRLHNDVLPARAIRNGQTIAVIGYGLFTAVVDTAGVLHYEK